MNQISLGQIVKVRSRHYLVQEIIPPPEIMGNESVNLACVDDDAIGEELTVFWHRELDAKILPESSWDLVAKKGFDRANDFSAYLHTLRWNCVTSTKKELFQSPYRAGIQIKTYQLEPLRKALSMPRVSLFIADDVGLGKTIEAGLILREMILRQKVKRVVISCPPSVVQQWQEEMEHRFGLLFQIFDREFMASRRRERGYGVNPWKTHNRFIISHALLRDETYAAPLRDWLDKDNLSAGSLLILDEAHHAAPSSSSRYAVDSHLTKVIREIAPKFEHKLFLSATPHNGHSNSFAALLEILDPQRFCRGIPVQDKKLLEAVMVRRLKQDLRGIKISDFPERQVIPIIIDGLPNDAPELKLAELLQAYRSSREERLTNAKKSIQTTTMLVLTSLQKRLLSSIEAFAQTLKVHRRSIERSPEKFRSNYPGNSSAAADYFLLNESISSDDDRADLDETEVDAEEAAQMTAASQAIAQDLGQVSPQELQLLATMADLAENARYQSDSRTLKLIEWIRINLCPNLGQPGAEWNQRRLLIFTEYADTKRYLERQLNQAIANSDQAEDRIATFHGGIGDDRRESIKAAFNMNPANHPLRILIATDAAREGVNLQNYCADLFHFDLPWNPSRMEQRNGRIDRKLQREAIVRCHYFILRQRPEDRVLDVLVQKTQTILQELGSLPPVVEKNLGQILAAGISAKAEGKLTEAIGQSSETGFDEKTRVIQGELEPIREQQQKLYQQQKELEEILQKSRQWLGLDDIHFRHALSVSLQLMGAEGLQLESSGSIPPNPPFKKGGKDTETSEKPPLLKGVEEISPDRYILPNLDQQTGDATWANTLDSLRPPRPKGKTLWDWRRETSIRPVVFRDPGTLDGEVVHLHLEHRLVQRLLGRFLSQGFTQDQLTRACVCLTRDAIPKVIILGRLSLYGDRAARLHDEILAVAAEWNNPESRGRGKLRPLSETEKTNVMDELETCLGDRLLRNVPDQLLDQFKAYVSQDVAELKGHLAKRADIISDRAIRELTKRGEQEAKAMQQLLTEQRDRILQQQNTEHHQLSLFNADEKRQLEADRRYWEIRVNQLTQEIDSEPERIKQSYQVKATRIEPVGVVYLWPTSS
jgi:superfamily II DNA or RNA helicase